MGEGLTVLLSVGIPVLSIALVVANFVRGGKKDIVTDAKNEGIIASDLGYIKKGIEEIQKKQERQDEKHEAQYVEVITRLTAVEGSAKRAHDRLDEMGAAKR